MRRGEDMISSSDEDDASSHESDVAPHDKCTARLKNIELQFAPGPESPPQNMKRIAQPLPIKRMCRMTKHRGEGTMMTR